MNEINDWKEKEKALEREIALLNKEKSQLKKRTMFKLIKNNDDLPFNMMDTMNVGSRIDLPALHGEIYSVKEVYDRDGVCALRTHFSNKAILPKHYHSDCIEIVLPIKGSFSIETEDGSYTVAEGDAAKFAIGEAHQVHANDDEAVCMVLFSRHPIVLSEIDKTLAHETTH